MKDFKEISKYFHLSSTTELKGIQLLQPLLNAIKEKNTIEFKHENYHTYNITNYKLEPYLLKEYLNRWYVVGIVPSTGEFRTFGIDRIEDLVIRNTLFERNNKVDPRTFFEDTIGLVYTEHELQPVLIQASEHQAKYIKSLPLHTSQQTLNNFKFSLTLTPNYELIQRILMMGSEVQVLKPLWLRDKIKGTLKKALESYK